jgi:hypothetical protein
MTTIEVANPAALKTALGAAPAPGTTIMLTSPTYPVAEPLVIPEGVTLLGAGRMRFDDGLPDGFETGTATTITASTNLVGNLVTLCDGSTVRGLVLRGAPQPSGPQPVPEDGEGRGGNVVAVASTGKGTSVSATIDKCQLVNQIRSGGASDGPVGGAILAYTRNPQKPTSDPPPHEDATVTVTVTQSIVDTDKEGRAVFAMNFASGGKVTVKLETNVVRGPLDVIGGLSRPDAVVFATTTVDSEGNLYSAQSGSKAEAWQIIGGSDPPPAVPAGPDSSSDSNSARVESRDDQIKDFELGILAVGGRRLSSGGRGCSHNEVKLDLLNMTLDTKPQGADFVFVGARSGMELFSAGDGNIVHARIQQTQGSGGGRNLYADSQGFGTGNKLIFVGTRDQFMDSNDAIEAPSAEFFEHGG